MLRNSSTEREPFLFRSSLLKLWLSRLISSASTGEDSKREKGRERERGGLEKGYKQERCGIQQEEVKGSLET